MGTAKRHNKETGREVHHGNSSSKQSPPAGASAYVASRIDCPACRLAGVLRLNHRPRRLALQKAVHKVIDGAEPSVACVLVSRSKQYAELGEGPTEATPGKLNGFSIPRHIRLGGGAKREMIKRLDLSNPETVPESYGSAVVIDDRGLLLTNFHVIDGATKVYVRLPGAGRGSYADILAGDPRSDLAILKMLSPPADLKALPFGTVQRCEREIGSLHWRIRSPRASRTAAPGASNGIVSNVRRQAPGSPDETRRAKPLAQYGTLIQTDARLNLGCSGAPC